VHTALLEAAMPPMATAAAWAGDRGLCPELGASLVSVGILAALAWIPLLSWALTAQGIP
jgi:predicted permease